MRPKRLNDFPQSYITKIESQKFLLPVQRFYSFPCQFSKTETVAEKSERLGICRTKYGRHSYFASSWKPRITFLTLKTKTGRELGAWVSSGSCWCAGAERAGQTQSGVRPVGRSGQIQNSKGQPGESMGPYPKAFLISQSWRQRGLNCMHIFQVTGLKQDPSFHVAMLPGIAVYTTKSN